MSRAQDLLRQVRVRIAAAAAVEDLQVGVAAGAGASLALLAAHRLGLPVDPSWSVWGGVAVAAVFPAAGLLGRRMDDRSLAARADEGLALRERLSSALWCARDSAAGPLAALVVADADGAAGRVDRAALAHAFRPRMRRKPLLVAGALAAGIVALAVWQPVAEAVESPAAKAARLADADRVAQVARKIEEQAKRVADEASKRNMEDLARLSRQVTESARAMQRDPPPKEQATSRLNQLSELAKAEARRRANLRAPADTPEANAQDKALAELLQALSKAGLESLQKDLSELEKRLQAGDTGGGEKPSAESLRSLAERVDALRRAMEAASKAGATDLEKRLQSIANEDLLEKIAERLRELAAKLEQRGYQGLEPEDTQEDLDLGQMSREELEELLKQLEEMAAMQDLSEMLGQGGSEARGGKRMRVPRPGGSGGT